MTVFCLTILVFVSQERPPQNLDSVLQMYVQALGGQAALDRIRTREIHGTIHGSMDAMPGKKSGAAGMTSTKVICYWEKPDKAAEIQTSLFGMIFETGFDGTEEWFVIPRGKSRKPDRAAREELQTTANPLRYASLKTLYPGVQLSPSESLDSKPMDVLAASNDNGATKFYFDHQTHLLVYISEIGVTSNYYKRAVRFEDYKKVDGIEYPFRIAFTPPSPDSATHEMRVSKLKQNVEIDPEQFKRPTKK